MSAEIFCVKNTTDNLIVSIKSTEKKEDTTQIKWELVLDNAVIGKATATLNMREKSSYLALLKIKKNYRGQKHGSHLLETIKQQIFTWHINDIMVLATSLILNKQNEEKTLKQEQEDDKRVLRFYQNNGFEILCGNMLVCRKSD